MDTLFDLALMAHLLSLLAAGAAVVAMPLIGGRLATAAPEARPVLGSIAQQIGLFSRVAFGVLLVSGPLMVWLRFGGVAGLSTWFWVKMALIVVMAASMAIGGRYRQKSLTGDKQAAGVAKMAANVSRLALLGVVVTAVLAFN